MAAPHAMESRHVGAIDGPGTTKKTTICHRGPARDGLAILRAQPPAVPGRNGLAAPHWARACVG